jgi:5,10-methenyltetrahydromethanopterin hydrogenase
MMRVKKIYIELETEFEVDYSPERPAPHCQDHSSPRYSDPGDPEEVEITEAYFRIGDKLVKIPAELMGYICDTCIDDVTSVCREQYDGIMEYVGEDRS